MKKLISNISGAVISVFAFLGFLLPAVALTTKFLSTTTTETTSGFDFMTFESVNSPLQILSNLNTLQIVFSVIAILFFIVAGLLAIVSVVNFFIASKKINLKFIQSILAVVLSVLAIAILVMVIAYVVTYNNGVGGTNMYTSIGFGMILIPIVTLIGSALVVLFNGSKK